MFEFIREMKARNETLFYFGLFCLVLAVAFIIASRFSTIRVSNVNAWYKPFKFALSITAYSWTMAWYCHYLKDFNIVLFNWTIIILLGFEIIYIGLQAARGQMSHFNVTTPYYAVLYSLMAVAATGVAVYTGYVGILFLKSDFPDLPSYYVTAIRAALFIFVLFSFQGFLMGAKMSHTVGGADGDAGIPLLNWSRKYGDLRIAHFIGMHALQVLPFLAFYVLRSTKAVVVVSVVYLVITGVSLWLALRGVPMIPQRSPEV
ncbi:MAG: hypothetical protein EOP56_14470 [Sphingobacteriales bacterium]|nr:MAG: hypothetical protein EOP56_14470 [Sphingobacteriales bacterium]